jgi:hypothetical protein
MHPHLTILNCFSYTNFIVKVEQFLCEARWIIKKDPIFANSMFYNAI